MDTQTELVHRLVRQANSKNASSFFINGSPGTGKTYLLQTLAKELPTYFKRACVLGPYQFSATELSNLAGQIAKDMNEATFTGSSAISHDTTLADTWEWISTHGQFSSNQHIFILIDLPNIWNESLPVIGNVLSSARYLEGNWKHRELNIHHIFTGFWDHTQLEKYYNHIHTSFPYTIGHNYEIWSGIEEAQMIDLVAHMRPEKDKPISGRVIYEITGGHPGVALEIIRALPIPELTLQAITSATQTVAQSGMISHALVNVWKKFPVPVKQIVQQLLLKRQLMAVFPQNTIEQLEITGLIRLEEVNHKRLLTFNSWYVELVARLHIDEIGIQSTRFSKILPSDLMPSISVVNQEAYRIINDVENSMRNFLTIYLSSCSNSEKHILSDRCYIYDKDSGRTTDAYTRAKDWQTRNGNREIEVGMNPLIAYCSIRDLAKLAQDIKQDNRSSQFQVAEALEEIGDIRDAVMHAQFIEFQVLEKLNKLRDEIFSVIADI